MIFCNKCGHQENGDGEFCSKCGSKLNRESLKVDSQSDNTTQQEKQKTPILTEGDKSSLSTVFGCMGCLTVIILFVAIVGSCTGSPTPTKSFKDITNKEMKDFLDWKIKQDQKKWENDKYFK